MKKIIKTSLIFLLILGYYFLIKEIAIIIWKNFTKFDAAFLFHVPGPMLIQAYLIFIFIALFLLSIREEISFCLGNKTYLFASLFFAAVFTYTYSFISIQFALTHKELVFFLNRISLFSSIYLFGIFLLTKKSIKKYSKQILTIYLITILIIFFSLIDSFGKFLTSSAAYLVSQFLNLLGNSSINHIYPGKTTINFNEFTINLSIACSGIESIILFLMISLAIFYFDGKKIKSKKNYLLWVISGIVILYFLNLIRLIVLMIIGQKNPVFAITSFHYFSGTILFLLFMIPYIYYLYNQNIKKETKYRKNHEKK